jgi:HAE1 family hydrophobic/amphiphilic exporter-1
LQQVVKDRTPSLLERKDRQPAVTLTADALGRPSGTVADEVVAYLKKNPLPEGMYSLTWGSDIKRQNDSFGALGGVLAISFLLIYLIMVALYDSFVYPFVALVFNTRGSDWGIFSPEFIVEQFEFVCPFGLDYAHGFGDKKRHFDRGFHQPTQSRRAALPGSADSSGQGTDAPNFDDHAWQWQSGCCPSPWQKVPPANGKTDLAWVIIGGLLSSLILTVLSGADDVLFGG